jgi:hypothetical protein
MVFSTPQTERVLVAKKRDRDNVKRPKVIQKIFINGKKICCTQIGLQSNRQTRSGSLERVHENKAMAVRNNHKNTPGAVQLDFYRRSTLCFCSFLNPATRRKSFNQNTLEYQSDPKGFAAHSITLLMLSRNGQGKQPVKASGEQGSFNC